MAELTDQQMAFAKHYAKSGDRIEAACLAGYPSGTARQRAYKLLNNPRVLEAVEAHMSLPKVAEVVTKNEIGGSEHVLSGLYDIVNFDLQDVATYDGKDFLFKPFDQWPEGASRAVLGATVKEFKDGSRAVEFRFESKIKALDKLGQHHGMWSSFEQLVAGLKTYGIELVRRGDQFMIKGQG